MNTSRNIRTMMILLALFMSSALTAFADDIVAEDIIIDDGIEHGTVVFKEADQTTRTVTLTVTPDANYFIQKINIKVEKLVDPSKAMAPRRAPAIADELEVSGPEESAVAADFTFVLPADYDGALVTATFTAQVEASAVVTANNLMYNQTAQPLVTLGQVTGSTFYPAGKGGTPEEGEDPPLIPYVTPGTSLVGYYTLSGGIYQACTEEAVAFDGVTYYKPNVKFSLTIDGTYTTDIPTATDAGTYTVYYKIEPDHAHIEASGSVEVTIVPASLTSVKLAQTAQKYTGSELTFTVSEVKAGSLTLSPSDYTVTDNIQTAIGAYTLTVTGTGSYTGLLTLDYRIVDGSAYTLIETTTAASDINDMDGNYVLVCDIDASILANLYRTDVPFTGTFDGGFHTISGLSGHGLFNTINGGTVKNVRLQDINVNTGNANGDVGAICNVATGSARIYNCGVLSTDVVYDVHGWVQTINETSGGSHVSGTRYVGGLVGLLDGSTIDETHFCTARVINCYSYATITGGTERGGIVGYNNYASKYNDVRTMVMNCMFYGDILAGGTIAPVYGGLEISNDYNKNNTNRLNNYNYFVHEAPFNARISKFNCALAAEERFLVRFEFYRNLLNSTRELAAWYAVGDPSKGRGKVEVNEMAKWVLDKTIAPYPILMPQGTYPSVVNYDPEFTYDDQRHRIHRTTVTERARGRFLGKTLSVNITMPDSPTAGQGKPSGAALTTTSLILNRIDKDSLNYNFNYDKVQLPYYNEVGTGNYTGNKVVTGWMITTIVGGTAGGYSETNYDYPNYNYADRSKTGKDLYDTSKRIFAQGAYFNVPEGVTAITIEPYWGKAVYLSDAYYDRYGYNNTDDLTLVSGEQSCGQRYANNTKYNLVTGAADSDNGQTVYTHISNALAALTGVSSATVYDYAVVLVGNYHHHTTIGKEGLELYDGDTPFTIMSIDLNEDNEPDYSLIYRSGKNKQISPIRFDFINVPAMSMAHKMASDGDLAIPGNCCPRGWFEITTTGLIKYGQFEHSYNGKSLAPLIFMGGVIDQFVANNTGSGLAYNNKTKYMLFGDNVWFKMLSNGGHMDKNSATPHRPISLTGGEYEILYLSGYFRPDANYCSSGGSGVEAGDWNAECYIDGGRFGEVAGAGQEKIDGDVTWLIDHADIQYFYGGGINANKPISGSISTTLKNSYVGVFCGGPKFGDMATNKTVTTTATDCEFGTYFGAGYGGTSIFKEQFYNVYQKLNYNEWNSKLNANYNEGTRGFYYNNKGIAFDYEYEFFGGTSGNVHRMYIKYASFSLAQTHDVTSTLTGCTIHQNFYGGGSLGAVDGNATSTLTNCLVKGNAYGAGYSVSIPSVEVRKLGGFSPEPVYNTSTGIYEEGGYPGTDTFTWGQVASLGDQSNALDSSTIKTTANLSNLGIVTGNASLTIAGNTRVEGRVENGQHVGGMVYGGGAESNVLGNTNVTMTDGFVYDRIYGGGELGDVGTFRRSTDASQTAAELANYAAYVAAYPHTEPDPEHPHDCVGKPVSCADNTGKCTIAISGGQVGPLGMMMNGEGYSLADDYGYVFGAGRGKMMTGPDADTDIDFRTYVNSTDVTISGSALIFGGVYGGSENGRVLTNTHVTIAGGQIGAGEGEYVAYTDEDWESENPSRFTECTHWPYAGNTGNFYDIFADEDGYYHVNPGSSREDDDFYYEPGAPGVKVSARGGRKYGTNGHTFYGNVFGGGSGFFPYAPGKWLKSAGCVEGNTVVDMTGGHVITNVYGGNEMTDVLGSTNVNIVGGTVGVPRTVADIQAHPLTCYVFGGGKGDARTFFNQSTNVANATVNISGNARIFGSTFGGGEDGHVLGDAVTNIGGNVIIGGTSYPHTNVIIGTTGTSHVDGNIFGGGRGFSEDAYTAGVVAGNVTVNIHEGMMLGSVYGGGRNASVGTYLVMMENANYGHMQPDEDETHTHGHITINITGGRIGAYDEVTHQVLPSQFSIGDVFGGCMGALEKDPVTYAESISHHFGLSKHTTINLSESVDGLTHVHGSIYGGGEAGDVLGNVAITINGGSVGKDVYGGGALSDTSTNFDAAATSEGVANLMADDAVMKATALETTITLHGGTIEGNVYGGGLGRREVGTSGVEGYISAIEALECGDVTVLLNPARVVDPEDDTKVTYPDNCVVKGSIFGCNNQNGTPLGSVLVHVYKTQGYAGHWRTGYEAESEEMRLSLLNDDNEDRHSYEVQAVYGGGNLAAYEPTAASSDDPDVKAGAYAHVIIDGCDMTSIRQVYGGGNAACTPATRVDVFGTYEVEEVFGGGNGKDDIPSADGLSMLPNPGANVGYKNYSEYYEEDGVWKVRDLDAFDTKDERIDDSDPTTSIVYGSGAANVNIYGGRIHRVFGGSNTKGNVRAIALTMLEDVSCEFCVDEAYGGGKSAPMDGESRIEMACIPGLKAAYGGAENADIHNDVTLNITNGTYDRVFGGNNISGTIDGTITVNIEETGCKPLIIGQLYGGGNQAPYTAPWIDDEDHSKGRKHGPTLNVRSFTSIGEIYGGGYGRPAVVTGDTYVNVNVSYGEFYNTDYHYLPGDKTTADYTGTQTIHFIEYERTPSGDFVYENGERKYVERSVDVYLPPHTLGTIGGINKVFGGGNAADVTGNTNVIIATETEQIFATPLTKAAPDPADPPVPTTDADRTHTVIGATVVGDVYGGGNAATVTGNTNVVIGR